MVQPCSTELSFGGDKIFEEHIVKLDLPFLTCYLYVICSRYIVMLYVILNVSSISELYWKCYKYVKFFICFITSIVYLVLISNKVKQAIQIWIKILNFFYAQISALYQDRVDARLQTFCSGFWYHIMLFTLYILYQRWLYCSCR